jgi:hypothetical protein
MASWKELLSISPITSPAVSDARSSSNVEDPNPREFQSSYVPERRFTVGVQALTIQQALNFVATRHPGGVVRVKFPIAQDGSSVEGRCSSVQDRAA